MRARARFYKYQNNKKIYQLQKEYALPDSTSSTCGKTRSHNKKQ